MNLTLPTVKKLSNRALLDRGMAASVVGAYWIGERCRNRNGNGSFRVARVVIQTANGELLAKLATLETDGSFRIA